MSSLAVQANKPSNLSKTVNLTLIYDKDVKIAYLNFEYEISLMHKALSTLSNEKIAHSSEI